jgi:hypothetical protein
MRKADFVIAAALIVGVAASGLAQSASTAQTTTASAPPATTSTFTDVGHWFASAYLGPNWGGSSDAFTFNNTEFDTGSRTGINYGAEIGYAWSGAIGAEFLVNYAPNFELNSVLLQRRPSVSSYMGNVIAAIPIGEGHRAQPFVSGGIGAVNIRSTIFTIDPGTPGVNVATLDTTTDNGSRFGWNLGGGAMVFNGSWGLRGDVRYFKATTNDTITDDTPTEVFLNNALSGLSYWTANFGVAFRW